MASPSWADAVKHKLRRRARGSRNSQSYEMPKLRRMMSGCVTPEQQLEQAIKDNDVQTLRRLLETKALPMDKPLEPPHLITPLQLASQLHPDVEEDGESCLKLLLYETDNPNQASDIREGFTALHLAAEACNFKALQILLQDGRVNVNAKSTSGGNVLHALVRNKPETSNSVHQLKKCIDLLLDLPTLDVDHRDNMNKTAISRAAMKRNRVAVEAMLESGRVDVDAGEPAARKLISEYFSDLKSLLPAEGVKAGSVKEDSVSTLFRLLCARKSSAFITELGKILYRLPNNGDDGDLQSRREILNGDNGCWSFLQYACNAGMTDVARTLLDNGADPNVTSASRPNLLPSILAAAGGYDKIVELLLKNPNARLFAYRNGFLGSGETALHAVLKNAKWEPHNSDRRRCFDLLVAQDVDRLDVNAGDRNGDTALHLAAISGEEHYVMALLRKGVYVGKRNVFDELPLANIASSTLERFLDECVNSNDEFPRDDKFEITFNYSFLVPPAPQIGSDHNHLDATCDQESSMIYDNQDHVNPEPESNPLLYISKSPDLRPLLKHPIFTSFLSLKWFTIRPFFILNVSFYALFVFLLTVYILFIYDYPVVASENSTSIKAVEETRNKRDVTTASEMQSSAIETLVWWILTVLFVVLLLRELFQFVMWPKHYLLNFENYLEAALIAVSALVLFGGFDNAAVIRPHLSALAILLSWAELVLLIGKHPRLSTNIEMFMTVSKNFLQFLAWYSLLILAFALSFYTLFRSSQGENNFFLNPGSSFFKTVIMVTGEFDASDIPFVLFPVTSHAVFVLFVFLVAIVLFNLLNGLAVSDTQVIKDDAKLVGYVSRVKLVSYTERMVLGHPLWCHTPTTCCCCCTCCCVPLVNFRFLSLHRFPSLIRRVRLFNYLDPDHVIRVLPNQNGKIVLSQTLKSDAEKYMKAVTCCKMSPCIEYKLEEQVINEAKTLLEEKNEMSDVDRIEARLENILHDKVERLEEMFNKLQDEIKTWQQKISNIVQSKC